MLPNWTRTTIAGTPVDVFEPPDALPFALLYLHAESGETPATNPEWTAELRSRRLRCVAPQVGQSWWVDRINPEFDSKLTAERDVLDNVVPWMETTWKLGPRALALGGVGMGGQGAVRLGFKFPERFPIVASVSGAFDFHERYGWGTLLDEQYPSREHARQDTAILHVQPHDWPPHVWFACPPGDEWYRGNDRLHEKLAAIGAPHVADLDTRSEPRQAIGAMLTFVVGALERESRRLA